MKISHVLRGEEWLSSTPKHILLYRAFGWTPPVFAHLPLLLNKDRTKLSKRSGDLFVDSLRRDGMLPAAVTNFVALLGWTPKDATKEVFASLEDIATDFSLEDIHRAGAVVDMEKLAWFQRQHMKILAPEKSGDVVKDLQTRLKALYGSHTLDDTLFDAEYVGKVLEVCKQTYDSLDSLSKAVGYFFVNDVLDEAASPAIKSVRLLNILHIPSINSTFHPKYPRHSKQSFFYISPSLYRYLIISIDEMTGFSPGPHGPAQGDAARRCPGAPGR